MNAPAPANSELTGDLWLLAQTTAGARGFQFSERSGQLTRELIAGGVATLDQRGELQNAAKVKQAKDDLQKFVDKLVEHSIEIQVNATEQTATATATRMLHETNFFGARSRFCPCYPFC